MRKKQTFFIKCFMKIICVSGGSYKSFYLNHFLKLKRCDLLIFNFGIFYDYVFSDEVLSTGVVTKEIVMLSNILKCPIVAGVNVVRGKEKVPSIIYCDGDTFNITRARQGEKIFINKTSFMIGDNFANLKGNKIILSHEKIHVNRNNVSNKIYILCDSLGTTFIKNKKITRKFNKYSKFILK